MTALKPLRAPTRPASSRGRCSLSDTHSASCALSRGHAGPCFVLPLEEGVPTGDAELEPHPQTKGNPMSMWDDEAGYDRNDPKHPAWAGLQMDRADDDRKRAKENPPEPKPDSEEEA